MTAKQNTEDWKQAVSPDDFTGNAEGMLYDPEEDGVTHINVYSKGRTELGRLMSNFAYSPFTHPFHGDFDSIEGYWYWLSTGDDRLRKLSGYEAKKLGRELRSADRPSDDLFTNFQVCIKEAIDAKVKSNGRLRELLRLSSLPFVHYYVMYDKVLPQPSDDWIMRHWEKTRRELYR